LATADGIISRSQKHCQFFVNPTSVMFSHVYKGINRVLARFCEKVLELSKSKHNHHVSFGA
jgi:hypothetical protein